MLLSYIYWFLFDLLEFGLKTVKKVGMLTALFVSSLLLSSFAVADCSKLSSIGVEESSFKKNISNASNTVVEFIENKSVPGLSLAVIKDNKLIWSEGFGCSNISHNTVMTPDTQMRISSISKTLTATGIGILLQQGKIALDSPVKTYISNLPQDYNLITIADLAWHRSGIRHYENDQPNEKQYSTVNGGLEKFVNEPLKFTPASNFLYSSFGWNLLGAAIENITGETYLGFMQKNVFQPLGLSSIVALDSGHIIKNEASYYLLVDDAFNEVKHENYSYKWPSAGYLSTASDLVKLSSSYFNEKFLKKQARDALWTPDDMMYSKFAIGWFYSFNEARSPRLQHYMTHSGSSKASRAILRYFPASNTHIAILVNTRNKKIDLGKLANKIIQLL